MPTTFDKSFGYRTGAVTFMDQQVTVWATTFVPLKDDTVTYIAARIFAEALHAEFELLHDLAAPLRKAIIGILRVEVDAASRSTLTGECVIVECSIWSECESHEPGALCEINLLHRSPSPHGRTKLAARFALPTAAVAAEKKRNRTWLETLGSYRHITIHEKAPTVESWRRDGGDEL